MLDDGAHRDSAKSAAERLPIRRVGALVLAVVATGGAIVAYVSSSENTNRTPVRVDAPGLTSAPPPTVSATTTTVSATTTTVVPANAADAAASRGAEYNGYTGIDRWTPLFTARVDRYDVRAFLQKTPIISDTPPPDATRKQWTPSAFCMPTGSFVLEISDAAMVATLSASYFDELHWGPVVSSQYVGFSEGEPVLVAIGQVGPGDAVTIVLHDGREVPLTIRDRLAYAIVPLDPSILSKAPVVAAWRTTTGGKTTTTSEASGVGMPFGPTPTECVPPPPPLPAPGEQPKDIDAAEAAVAKAMAAVFGGSDEDAREALIDDPHGLSDVRAALLAGSFAELVRKATAEISDIVFTSPDRAAARYTILAGPSRFDRIAELRRVDGTWKVTRASYCEAVGLAEVTCPD